MTATSIMATVGKAATGAAAAARAVTVGLAARRYIITISGKQQPDKSIVRTKTLTTMAALPAGGGGEGGCGGHLMCGASVKYTQS